jgi:hypothetical protein
MRMPERSGAAGVLAVCLVSSALACGLCIEDKIAAVYDHAVATRAIAQKHAVVFFAVEGNLPAGDASRRMLEKAAESIPGVDRGSARASVESASLGAAFDPARVPAEDLESKLGRKLAGKGLTVGIMRIMEKPSELKVAGKR